MEYAKLNRMAFALAAGIFWGAGIFFTTFWAMAIGRPESLGFLAFYPGYSVSVIGAFVGLLWGFTDGFIGGFIFAALYNYILWLLSIRKKDESFVNSLSDSVKEDE